MNVLSSYCQDCFLCMDTLFGSPQECYAGHGNIVPSVEPQPAAQSNGKIRQTFQALILRQKLKKEAYLPSSVITQKGIWSTSA